MRRWAEVLQAFRIFRRETTSQFLKVYVQGCHSVRRKGIRPKRTPFGSTVLWWVVKQVAPSSPSLGCRWPLPRLLLWHLRKNHEYRFDISTSVSRCIFGNLKFSHHKSSKSLIEDSDSHVVPLTPHFLMIFRQQFGKVASFFIWTQT